MRTAEKATILALAAAFPAWAAEATSRWSPTNIFAPVSTPADEIFKLSLLVLSVTAAIFIVVFSMLVYASIKFRERRGDDGREPSQIYGSTQVELAWTVIPVVIVAVLFITASRVIVSVQGASRLPGTVEVTVIGHQYWWEFRYPDHKVVTANELHIPVSDPAHPTRTFLSLYSADTDHSFWVPRLAGKTDLIPNHPNTMWLDPHETGLYLGQCAQYCGVQHGLMLLRVYVQTREEFDQWIGRQSQPAAVSESVSAGRRIFETTACINCHTVAGTVANGQFGPDLTHLMSRETIGSGAADNTHDNLRRWIKDPSKFKQGCLMPAMGLSDAQLDAVTAYMETLR
jgi:cytochrome c oxidase subunit II